MRSTNTSSHQILLSIWYLVHLDTLIMRLKFINCVYFVPSVGMASCMEHQSQVAVLSGSSLAALGRLKESKFSMSLTLQMDTIKDTNKCWPFCTAEKVIGGT